MEEPQSGSPVEEAEHILSVEWDRQRESIRVRQAKVSAALSDVTETIERMAALMAQIVGTITQLLEDQARHEDGEIALWEEQFDY